MIQQVALLGLFIGFLVAWGFFAIVYEVLLRRAQAQMLHHYQHKYNEQFSELCVRYRQERTAMAHRYEGRIADIQQELENIAAAMDRDKTEVI